MRADKNKMNSNEKHNNETHLAHLVHRQAKAHGNRCAIRYKDYDAGHWVSVNWSEFSQKVQNVACAMLNYGVEVQENIGIFSQNMPQCFYVDFAAFDLRAVVVPLYATSSEVQVQHIVNNTSIRILFVDEQQQYDVAYRVLSVCPTLHQLVVFDRKVMLNGQDKSSVFFDEFISQTFSDDCKEKVNRRMNEVSFDDLATILFTSGTTGESKGVMLHHSCYRAAIRAHVEELTWMSHKDVILNFLPLTHVFERTWLYICLTIGAPVCINRYPARIRESMLEIRPTAMCSVPRFWEKIYHGAMEEINRATGVKRKILMDALKVGRMYYIDYIQKGKTPPLRLAMQNSFYERTVFSFLKKRIGLENGRFFPTAGATISKEVEEFVHSVGIGMIVGYGLTESTATVTLFWRNKFVIGSVGKPLSGVEVKIGANDEICIRGETITKGYYHNEIATQDSFDEEGWFHTGDAGYFKDGCLYLTDRIKDLFKTSNGKYIAPQSLETRLIVDRFIDQIVIIADNRKYVSALIVPNYVLLKDYAQKKDIHYNTIEDLLENSQIHELFEERIETLQQQFASYEQIKRFTLLPSPFSLENGELSNTLKIKRNVVNKNYAILIEKMYEK